MKYAVDRIENEIAILEETSTGIKKEVSLNELPESLTEGNILIYENDSYRKDIKEEASIKASIKSKFDMLRKK